MTTAPSELLEAAVAYAARGRRVFPLHSPLDTPDGLMCDCGKGEACPSPAKHPRTANGVLDATTDADAIRRWWGMWPTGNIGLAMGDGLSAVDIDPRHSGDESISDLGTPLPDTVTSLTGGDDGGRHLLFRVEGPTPSKASVLPGVDVRGDGGYIVAPPSWHVSGRSYEWESGHAPGDLRPAPLPEVIAALLDGAKRTTDQAPAQDGAIIAEGVRNAALASLGGTMRRRGMTPDAIAAALVAENAARCQPPLAEDEVRTIAASVGRYAPETASDGALAGPVLAQLSRVQREDVAWLWDNRIPLRRLTGIVGDPGVGKSWLTLAVGAAVTRGHGLPGQASGEPGRVLLLTAEDGLADTVRPRMEDMGADLERVTVLTAVRDAKGNERHPSLLTDIPMLEAALSDGGYRLIIIDPVNAYLGVDLDTHRDAPLRAVLGPLAALAERWRLAALFVLHLNKSQKERAIYRAQGGIAYVAAARVVHLVGQNPDDEHERVLATIKNNLAAFAPALAFELGEGQFAWRGETAVTPSALLGPDGDAESRTAQDEAAEFLRELLAGGPVAAKEVYRQAREVGISERTLNRAKAPLGVRSQRLGEPGQRGGGGWAWSLPAINIATTFNKAKVATLTETDRESPEPAEDDGNLNPDGPPLYMLSLAELLGWPAVSLAEREINGRVVSVGVPAGRSAWQQAARFWPPGLVTELIASLEGMTEGAGR